MTGASTEPGTGSATTTIAAPIGELFASVTDLMRPGEWSPQGVACRWVGEGTGHAVGARFVGFDRIQLSLES